MTTKRYFITGTDTDCGKTYVTCQLLNHLNQHQQQKAQGLKPVASGVSKTKKQLAGDDILMLQQHNYLPDQIINHWSYETPISPHLAAKNQGEHLAINEIKHFCEQEQFLVFDYLLIEGAGGLLAPLNDEQTWLDFLQLTQIPVILVVGMRLGCLNHALLTDAILKANKLPCVGWIANHIDKNMLAVEENIATLSARLHMPLIATVPHSGEIDIHQRI